MTQTKDTTQDAIVNTKGEMVNVPDHFICPITMQVMVSPVMTRTGRNFERSAIVEWLRDGTGTCPCTRNPMTMSDLLPNRRLQAEIVSWRTINDIPTAVDEISASDILIVPVSQERQERVLKHAAATASRSSEPSRPRGLVGRLSLVARRQR